MAGKVARDVETGRGERSKVGKDAVLGGGREDPGDVEAVNGSVVYDRKVLMGVEGNGYVGVQSGEEGMFTTTESLKALTGKGQGSSQVVLIQADGA